MREHKKTACLKSHSEYFQAVSDRIGVFFVRTSLMFAKVGCMLQRPVLDHPARARIQDRLYVPGLSHSPMGPYVHPDALMDVPGAFSVRGSS